MPRQNPKKAGKPQNSKTRKQNTGITKQNAGKTKRSLAVRKIKCLDCRQEFYLLCEKTAITDMARCSACFQSFYY